MTKNVFAAVVGVVITLLPLSVKSEEVSHPRTLLGFLEPGMHVGIHSVEGTTSVLLDVYTDAQFAIARDLISGGRVTGDAAELAAKYPEVRKKLDAFVAKLTQDAPDANPDDVRVLLLRRTTLGKISAIGGDYVLIERDGPAKRRLVIAQSCLSRIDLDAESIRLHHHSLR